MRMLQRREQRRLARELEVLRTEMHAARQTRDTDCEYLLLCRIASQTEELNDPELRNRVAAHHSDADRVHTTG